MREIEKAVDAMGGTTRPIMEKPETELNRIAARLAQIAPSLAAIQKPGDVTLDHLSDICLALGAGIDFAIHPIPSDHPPNSRD